MLQLKRRWGGTFCKISIERLWNPCYEHARRQLQLITTALKKHLRDLVKHLFVLMSLLALNYLDFEEEVKKELERTQKTKELEKYRQLYQSLEKSMQQLINISWVCVCPFFGFIFLSLYIFCLFVFQKEWKDDNDDYTPYSEDITKKLESANVGDIISLEHGQHKYELKKTSKTTAIQENLVTKKQRDVIRKESSKNQEETNSYPKWWVPQLNSKKDIYIKADINKNEEARNAVAEFQRTMKSHSSKYEIVDVFFVQNEEMWKHHTALESFALIFFDISFYKKKNQDFY
ncbi:hypothetical protein RFI_05683 [Reticulomyxa filosa]|uniref:Uncharacterized protein n=1 Tax=Reticulomyxa filosa TaxID=46433 RepID=X6NYQ8_RETFI|nr:hypothetical protein RFI_05683 [Reticulomyxa filosa]|eukprot:ETO31435.1 hypothetical protein RFI_05683 [Reticulomyxa filosa]